MKRLRGPAAGLRAAAGLLAASLGVAACTAGNPFGSLLASGAATGNSSTLIGNTGSALIGNTGSALGPDGKGDVLPTRGAAFSGQVSGPSQLIGNTGSALIGNTGSALIGNTGSAYRVAAAVTQGPVARSLVYLTTPDDQFFEVDGKVVSTTTDDRGHYEIPAVLPENRYVVVNAMLPENRRLVGFTVSRLGTNEVDVDLATTYVLEFLRVLARREGKTFANFDLARLPDLATRTRALIEEGHLGVEAEHLTIGAANRLADAYAIAMSRHASDLLQAWGDLLGRSPAVLLTEAGTYLYGLNESAPRTGTESPVYTPADVAITADGAYIAQMFIHQIARVDSSGLLGLFTARTEADPSQHPAPPLPRSGAPVATTRIPEPAHVAADAQGNLYLTMLPRLDAPRHLILMLCKEASPKFGLTDLEAGKIYRVAGTPDARTDDQGFARPAGLALDAAGNLFVADQANSRIVRVDRATGALSAVAGKGHSPNPEPVVDTASPAKDSPLGFPSAVAWRQSGQDHVLYVLDGFNQRIRLVTAPGGDWSQAMMRTIAGSGKPFLSGSGFGVEGGFAGDGGPATEARFHFGRFHPTDWNLSDLSFSDLALTPDGSRLYVTDTVNRRVRAIDLAAGTIDTVAGGGDNPRDGLARACSLSFPSGIVVTPAGEVLVADRSAHAVRRLLPGR